MADPSDTTDALSQEYHDAHLSFLRVAIVEAAANREPILRKLHTYTADVIKAERDRQKTLAQSADPPDEPLR